MTDAELIEFATEFREGMLGDRPSHRTCFMVCAPLAPLLEMYGVPCDLVETDLMDAPGDLAHHFWIKLADGRALDPTADQLEPEPGQPRLPPVYLGKPLAMHGVLAASV